MSLCTSAISRSQSLINGRIAGTQCGQTIGKLCADLFCVVDGRTPAISVHEEIAVQIGTQPHRQNCFEVARSPDAWLSRPRPSYRHRQPAQPGAFSSASSSAMRIATSGLCRDRGPAAYKQATSFSTPVHVSQLAPNTSPVLQTFGDVVWHGVPNRPSRPGALFALSSAEGLEASSDDGGSGRRQPSATSSSPVTRISQGRRRFRFRFASLVLLCLLLQSLPGQVSLKLCPDDLARIEIPLCASTMSRRILSSVQPRTEAGSSDRRFRQGFRIGRSHAPPGMSNTGTKPLAGQRTFHRRDFIQVARQTR